MKRLLRNGEQTPADAAALLDRGIPVRVYPDMIHRSFAETVEELFVEVAFAEAADYDDIQKAILREHLQHRRAA